MYIPQDPVEKKPMLSYEMQQLKLGTAVSCNVFLTTVTLADKQNSSFIMLY